MTGRNVEACLDSSLVLKPRTRKFWAPRDSKDDHNNAQLRSSNGIVYAIVSQTGSCGMRGVADTGIHQHHRRGLRGCCAASE